MNHEALLAAWNLDAIRITPMSGGLIHSTWKVEATQGVFLFQQLNTSVFQSPEKIHTNLRRVKAHLLQYHPDYLLPTPLALPNGDDLLRSSSGTCFRLFSFIEGSQSYIVANSVQLAYEAAFQFGTLTRVLEKMDTAQYYLPLPGFHDVSMRFARLEAVVKTAKEDRLKQSKDILDGLFDFRELEQKFRAIQQDPMFRIRMMHHDAKISNILFDKNDRGMCVVDLDTLMPGYIISDLGDLIRTFLSPVSEEEADLDKIEIRKPFFDAIEAGYLDALGDKLSSSERSAFVFAGQCMMYMQSLRFLTDFLENDQYYGAAYPLHNLVRAQNQLCLLQRFTNAKQRI